MLLEKVNVLEQEASMEYGSYSSQMHGLPTSIYPEIDSPAQIHKEKKIINWEGTIRIVMGWESHGYQK